MDRDIVVVVQTEEAAYQALRALRQLDAEGSIELHAAVIVSKESDGQVKLRDKRDTFGWGTLLGMSTGALVGLLGGPVGMEAGMLAGGGAGLSGDIAYSGFSVDFVRRVGDRLMPGMCAVIAHAYEDWTVPVDSAVAAFGGIVFRQSSADVAEAQLKSDMQALQEEQDHVEEEIARSAGQVKFDLEASREQLIEAQAQTRAKVEASVKTMQQRLDEEIASIQKKVSTSKAEAKLRHQRHVDKLSRFAASQKNAFQQLLH